jgi:hypothetical protein
VSYEAAGWTHWPAFPDASAQFARILGTSQEGGAAISECFLVASRIAPADPQSWYAAWLDRARRTREAAAAAQQAGHAQTARANWLRAATYYRASEMFLAPRDERRASVFRDMLACSRNWLGLLEPVGEVVMVPLGGGQALDAYFIRRPGSARAPCVICVGGLDGNKDELLPRMTRAALERGLALLLIDMPGQGETLRLRGLPNRPDCEVPVGRCVDYLQGRGDIDAERIALYGASLGGVYAARAASGEKRLKAVVSDSLVFDLHAALSQRLAVDAKGDWGLLQWVFGCDSPQAVVEKSRQFRMADFLDAIACPYLIVQGEHDFLGLQTAVDAYEYAKKAGVDVQLKVFTAEDSGAAHCQADNPTLGQEFIADWLKGILCQSSRTA